MGLLVAVALLLRLAAASAGAANSLADFGYYWGRSVYDDQWGAADWPELAAFAGHSTTTVVMNGGANATAMALADIVAIRQLRAKNLTAILGTPGNVLTVHGAAEDAARVRAAVARVLAARAPALRQRPRVLPL